MPLLKVADQPGCGEEYQYRLKSADRTRMYRSPPQPILLTGALRPLAPPKGSTPPLHVGKGILPGIRLASLPDFLTAHHLCYFFWVATLYRKGIRPDPPEGGFSKATGRKDDCRPKHGIHKHVKQPTKTRRMYNERIHESNTGHKPLNRRG